MNFAEQYGPWAVIAGASEGIGRAFAEQLAAQGINLVLVARRIGPLQALADELRARHGVEAMAVAADLSTTEGGIAVKQAVGAREVGLYISNAGADPNGARFLDRDLAVWEDQLGRNVLNLVRSCHHFGGAMQARGRGGILIVGSGACYGGGSFMSLYAASKAFALNFVESLWAELKPHGVDVLYLAAGMTDTPAFRSLLTEKGLPVPDSIADPQDVARKGLECLGQFQLVNWGLADDEQGYATSSAAARRARVEMIDLASKRVFGD